MLGAMRGSVLAFCLVLFGVGLGAGAAGCRPRSSPEYHAAEEELTLLLAELGDGAYLDPQMETIRARLRGVPAGALEAAQAGALLAKIDAESARVREHEAKLAAALAEARRPTPAQPDLEANERVKVPPAVEAAPPGPAAAGPRAVGPLAVFSNWHHGVGGYEAAIAEQRASGCPVLVYFHVGWCRWCKQLDAVVLPNPAVAAELSTAFKVKVDPEAGRAERRLADQFRVSGYPSVWLIAAQGDPPAKLPSGVGEPPRPKELSDSYHLRVADAWARQAHSALREGRTDEAIALADRLVALDPRHSNGYGYRVRAEAFRQKGELAEALRDSQLGCAAGCASCCAEKR